VLEDPDEVDEEPWEGSSDDAGSADDGDLDAGEVTADAAAAGDSTLEV
jgi:hypothetical protein